MNTTDSPRLLTRDEVAAELRYRNGDAVSRLVRAGLLPCTRFGKRLLFRPEDVAAFVASSRRDFRVVGQ